MSFARLFYTNKIQTKTDNPHDEAVICFQMAVFLQLAIDAHVEYFFDSGLLHRPEKKDMYLSMFNIAFALGKYAIELHKSIFYDAKQEKEMNIDDNPVAYQLKRSN